MLQCVVILFLLFLLSFCSYSDVEFQIRIYKEWDDRLEDRTSETFKEFSIMFEKEVRDFVLSVHPKITTSQKKYFTNYKYREPPHAL